MRKLLLVLLLIFIPSSITYGEECDRLCQFLKQRKGILANASTNALIHARVRASAGVSAASARGLTADTPTRNSEIRSEQAAEADLRTIEMIDISTKELEDFIRSM